MTYHLTTDTYERAARASIFAAEHIIRIAFYDVHLYPKKNTNPAYNIIADLINSAKRGTRIRWLFPPFAQNRPNARAANFLKNSGINVRTLPDSIRLHAKLIICDHLTLITGSHNLSYSSLSRNIESAIITTDQHAISNATTYFDFYWRRAHSLN